MGLDPIGLARFSAPHASRLQFPFAHCFRLRWSAGRLHAFRLHPGARFNGRIVRFDPGGRHLLWL